MNEEICQSKYGKGYLKVRSLNNSIYNNNNATSSTTNIINNYNRSSGIPGSKKNELN